MRSHGSKLSKTRFKNVLQQQLTCNSCQFCDKVCEGLISHIKVHVRWGGGKWSYNGCFVGYCFFPDFFENRMQYFCAVPINIFLQASR